MASSVRVFDQYERNPEDDMKNQKLQDQLRQSEREREELMKQFSRMQEENRRIQEDYNQQIQNLQEAFNSRNKTDNNAAAQADYENQLKAYQDAFATKEADYKNQLKAIQDSLTAQQEGEAARQEQLKADLEAGFAAQREAEKNSEKNQALAALKQQYEDVSGGYTPKTAEELEAQARDEYKSQYDRLTLAARQQQEQQDLALEGQIEGIGRAYDKQREQTNKVYDRNVSEADRRLLSRGMQRSSYGQQTLSNIDLERADAIADINAQQSSDEANIAAQRAQLKRQLADTERGYAENLESDVRARQQQLEGQEYDRKFQQNQLKAQLASDLYTKQYGQTRDDVSDTQWDKQFTYGQQRDNVGDQQWQQQFTEGQRQFNENLGYQKERAAASDNQWQQTFDYGKERDTVADQQWQAQFDYNKERAAASDAQWQASYDASLAQNNQSVADAYVKAILANGQMPSDDLLAAAGISKEDAQKLLAQANESTGGGRGGNGGNNGYENGDNNGGGNDKAFLEGLEGATYSTFTINPIADVNAAKSQYKGQLKKEEAESKRRWTK